MANHDYTADYWDANSLDQYASAPVYDLTHRRPYRIQVDLDHMDRQFPSRMRSTGFGRYLMEMATDKISLGFLAQNGAGRFQDRTWTTTPQFSGTVAPAGIYKVHLCRRNGNTEPAVMAVTYSAADGTFVFDMPPFRVGIDDEYFYQVFGNGVVESNDFLLKGDIVPHEPRYYADPRGNGIVTYDSSQDLRELLVEDQFTGGQSASMNGRMPDTVQPGSALWVASGPLVGAHNGGNFVAYTLGSGSTAVIDSGNSDVLIHAKEVFGDTSVSPLSTGIILRWVNSLNFILLHITNLGTALPSLSCTQYVAGAPTTINLRLLPVPPIAVLDAYYQWKVRAKGDNIRYQVTLGNKEWHGYVPLLTTHQSATSHGFMINAGQYIDDFKIWTL